MMQIIAKYQSHLVKAIGNEIRVSCNVHAKVGKCVIALKNLSWKKEEKIRWYWSAKGMLLIQKIFNPYFVICIVNFYMKVKPGKKCFNRPNKIRRFKCVIFWMAFAFMFMINNIHLDTLNIHLYYNSTMYSGWIHCLL